jgi:hypothetical protein
MGRLRVNGVFDIHHVCAEISAFPDKTPLTAMEAIFLEFSS